MVFYELEIKPSFHKDLKRSAPSFVPRIVAKVEALISDPLPAASTKLVNTDCSYRLRVGDYRVLYFFLADERRVIVTHVLHRREAYR